MGVWWLQFSGPETIVSINSRLGLLGYFPHASTSAGRYLLFYPPVPRSAAVNPSPVLRTPLANVAIEGVLLTMAAFPFLLACAGTSGEEPAAWRMAVAAAASLCCLGASYCFFRKWVLGKTLACLAAAGCGVAGAPFFLGDPRIALLAGVALIQAGFTIADYHFPRQQDLLNQPESRSLQRARGALWAVVSIAGLSFILDTQGQVTGEVAVAAALLLSQGMIAHWMWRNRKEGWLAVSLTLPFLLACAGYLALVNGLVRPTAAVTSLVALAVLPRPQRPLTIGEEWWEPLLNHPARILISTFFGLCLFGGRGRAHLRGSRQRPGDHRPAATGRGRPGARRRRIPGRQLLVQARGGDPAKHFPEDRAPGKWSRSSARPAPANRRSSACSGASTTPSPERCCSTAATSASTP